MEGKGVPKSCLIVSEIRDDSLCAMYLGISWAFVTLDYLSKQALEDQKWVGTRDKVLQVSAQLLGLLVWRVQREAVRSIEKCELLRKLEVAEGEISELKRRRSEDAKANEKVASIYAAQEQGWFTERRRLQQRLGGLLNDLRILDKRKNEAISEVNGELQRMEVAMKSKDGKLHEMENAMNSKVRMLEEGEEKRKELEEKVKFAEAALQELRETTKQAAQDHSGDLLKHKTAFIELVSNQRQLEAELGRALRQLEVAKQQLHFGFEEREEAVLMVKQLSLEIEKMHLDSEQKDKILSAIMRKSKLDSAEKQMLLKEIKISRPKRRKADTETERWGALSGTRDERRTLRNMLSRQFSARLEVNPAEKEENSISMGLSDADWNEAEQNDNIFDDLEGEFEKERNLEQSLPQESTTFDGTTRLNEWVHSEAEKYHNAVQQRHQLELDAFAEQMQMKDDKIEAYQCRLQNTELESKRLQSQLEGLNQDLFQLRHDNLKLEALLLDREVELKTLKDKIALQFNNLSAQRTKLEHLLDGNTACSKIKIMKKKAGDKGDLLAVEVMKEEETQSLSKEKTESLSKETSSAALSSTDNTEVKEVILQTNPACLEISIRESSETSGKGKVDKLGLNKRDKSQWKVDLHALGISYKIKRLSQQLLMLDRLAGKKESEVKGNDEHGQIRMKGFLLLLSLLNKQVGRYQSLQHKTDDLSLRMGDKELYLNKGVSRLSRTKEETKTLEHSLEETFQLQRFIVATGQKLMELQSKIASGFVGISEELDGSASFDMKRFADTIQSLFKDVQRGLEVRIARIIGDLGGTLACDGIMHGNSK